MAKKKNQKNKSALLAEDQDLKKSLSLEDYSTDAPLATTNQEESTEADDNREQQQSLDVQETTAISDDELKKELKRFLIPKIRSASYRWKFRSQAIKNARVSRGLYKCAMCGDSSLKNGDYVLDHRDPVVALDGWDGNWDTYINRMFVGTEGFQVLCTPCHDIKTDTEVQIRKMHREKKKLANKA